MNNYIGTSVKRREDQRFLTGRGTYTDDFNRPQQTYAYMLRSPHAHAALKRVDVTAAKAAPGVVAIFTGEDMKVGSIPCGWQIHNKDGSPMAEPAHPPLAQGFVRHVGDQIAVIIAESLDEAQAAAELIEIDYEPLPAVAFLGDAIKPGAPQVWDQAPGNICYDWHIGDKGPVDAAMAKAKWIAKIDLVNNRLVPNAMEPRAAISEYDVSSGDYTLTTTSQNPMSSAC